MDQTLLSSSSSQQQQQLIDQITTSTSSSNIFGSLSLLCCSSGALLYTHISEAAGKASSELIDELSVTPTSWGQDGHRDTRVVDALERIWSAIASENSDKLRLVPPRIPHRDWKKIGFQGDDPFTDMRGASVSGFIYIARLAEEYAGMFFLFFFFFSLFIF